MILKLITLVAISILISSCSYCTEFEIGKEYILDNQHGPFEKKKIIIVIEDIKDGYVKYHFKSSPGYSQSSKYNRKCDIYLPY